MARSQLIVVFSTLILIAKASNELFNVVGSFVLLNTQKPVPEFDDLFWKLNSTTNLLKYNAENKKCKPYDDYKGRVDFNAETYNLTLKNLQKNDSGVYEAKVSGRKDTTVAVHRLSVLDPVKHPHLTYQHINGTCNFTLTCSGDDLSINSICYKDPCEKKDNRTENIILSLSINDSFIICNVSNPADWKEDVIEKKTLTDLCPPKKSNSQKKNPLWYWIAGTVFILPCMICIALLYKRISTGDNQCDNTLYAEVQNGVGATGSIRLEPCTVYSTVGKCPVNRPATSNLENQQTATLELAAANTYETVMDKKPTEKPETIYATVTKPTK